MRLAWLSDIHLDHLHNEPPLRQLDESLALLKQDTRGCDAAVVTGDISVGNQVIFHVGVLRQALGMPVYFVLGNHDYYGSSWSRVEKQVYSSNYMAQWLNNHTGYWITPETRLVGQAGWYDARYGSWEESNVILNDWLFIGEYVDQQLIREPARLVELSRERADHQALMAQRSLSTILQEDRQPHHIVFATHYPPFDKACWHEGRMSGPDWLPWFTSKAMGEVLYSVASEYRDVKFTVLCGHTHSRGTYQPLANLTVRTAAAEYGKPRVEDILEL